MIGLNILRNMFVNELAAIVSITEKVVYPAGKFVFRIGDAAELMYMVISGEIEAYTDETEPPKVIKPGVSLGGVVLLTEDVSLLTIHERDFIEIIREHPQIGLDISKRLCEYIIELWKRAPDRSIADGNSIFNGPAGFDRPGQ